MRFFRFDLAYVWNKPSSLHFDLSNLWNKQTSLFPICGISRVRFASIFTSSGISRFVSLRYRKRSQDQSFVPPSFRFDIFAITTYVNFKLPLINQKKTLLGRCSTRNAYLWSLHAITLKIWLGDSNHASYTGGGGGPGGK